MAKVHVQNKPATNRFGRFVRVTSVGRLEVDGKRLFRDEQVKSSVEALRSVPVVKRPNG
jgi:hypothetical protein